MAVHCHTCIGLGNLGQPFQKLEPRVTLPKSIYDYLNKCFAFQKSEAPEQLPFISKAAPGCQCFGASLQLLQSCKQKSAKT